MKKYLLPLALLLLPALAHAQQVEWSGQLTSGVAAFGGVSSERTSAVIGSDTPQYSYVNNPFGRQWGVSYGAAGQGQWVGKRGLVLGAQLGYDMLRPATEINHYNNYGQNAAATGTSHLVQQFINFNPYLGQRLRMGSVALDATAGVEVARQLSSREKAEYTVNGTDMTLDNERRFRTMDYRLRGALTLSRGPVSLTASYARGLSNYRSGFVGGPVGEACLRVLRLGVAYRFN